MLTRSICLLTVLSASSLFAAPITSVSTADFMAGLNNADEAKIGPTANDTEADINSLFGPGWTEVAKFEDGTGLEGGSTIDLTVTPKDGGGFNWSFNSAHLDDFESAVFVVKQGSPQGPNPGGWVAYLFNDLQDASGMFFTENSFDVDDYSHLTMYVNGGADPVPEIDARSSILAVALLMCIVCFVRENRLSESFAF